MCIIIQTFGNTFCRATAVPLFELPALAAQSIWTNCCTGKNKKVKYIHLHFLMLYCPPVVDYDITCLFSGSYRRLGCGRKDSFASCWKLKQRKKHGRSNICRAQTTALLWIHFGCSIKHTNWTNKLLVVKLISLAPPVLMAALPFLPSCWSFRVSYTIWITGILKAWGWQVLYFSFITLLDVMLKC